jgi:hypothetical protein
MDQHYDGILAIFRFCPNALALPETGKKQHTVRVRSGKLLTSMSPVGEISNLGNVCWDNFEMWAIFFQDSRESTKMKEYHCK